MDGLYRMKFWGVIPPVAQSRTAELADTRNQAAATTYQCYRPWAMDAIAR